MYIKYMLALGVLCVHVYANAEVQGSCGSIQSYQDILSCAEKRAPIIQQLEVRGQISEAQKEAVGQWQNPQLSAQSISGKISGEDNRETDLVLSIPLDFSRSARQSQAGSEVELSRIQLLKAKTELRSEVYLNLQKLRQALRQKDLLSEALGTFVKLVDRFEARPLLGPEQQVSLALFRMAKSDYQLKILENDETILAIEKALQLSSGLSPEQIRKHLPTEIKKWPALPLNTVSGNSLPVQVAQAQVHKAEADLNLAESQIWEGINIGPSWKLVEQNGNSGQLFGVNLSLPLPVFNWNSGGKNTARAELKSVQMQKQIVLQEQLKEREVLVQVYQGSLQALKSVLSSGDLEKKHASVEGLFLRGLVSSALVIEAHRSLVDLDKARNERELKALEAYFKIHLLDGSLAEVDL